MVNAGAIATTSLAPGPTASGQWKFIYDGLSRFAGRKLALNEESLRVGHGNQFSEPQDRTIAAKRGPNLLRAGGSDGPLHQTMLLERQRQDLAVMGATLSDGGVNPITKLERGRSIGLSLRAGGNGDCRTLRDSGDWLFDIGLPGKSGIGGGIVTVSPGKGGIGTFAPPLDSAGNSVKGQLVAILSSDWGCDLFVSKPFG